MTEIIEREPSVGLTLPERSPRRAAFPRPMHRSQLPASTCAQLRSTRPDTRGGPRVHVAPEPRRGAALGRSEAQAIATENATKLGQMNADEIRKAQAELRAQLKALDAEGVALYNGGG